MLIDMHAHILPKADHGSDSLECSLSQIKKAASIGIKTILATPHYYQHRDSIKDFLDRREKCYNQLINAIQKEKIDIQIIKAAEVTLEVDLENDPDLPKLCIEGTNRILLEMPKIDWSDWVYNSVYNISVKHKVSPIIVHIDRYEEKGVKKLLEMGCETQINAIALNSFFQKRKMLKYYLNNQAQYLGSDVHDAEATQYDLYEKAIKALGPQLTDQLMENASRAIGLTKSQPKEKTNGGFQLF